MNIFLKKYHFIISLLIIMPSGCSSIDMQNPIYSAEKISRKNLLSGEVIFGDSALKIILPDDGVMDISDKMVSSLNHYVSQKGAKRSRIISLLHMMTGSGALGMKYDMSKTYTAQDAFKYSEGNCLAFSYLFAALARENGLKVKFQEIDIPPQWNPAGGTLYYISRHVNVRVQTETARDYVVDIDRINYKPHYKARIISEKQATALYYSNKGTDYLSEGDYKKAYLYLVKSLILAPHDAAVWSNLGVLYRLNGKYSYAEKSYFIALKYDSHNQSVLNNLVVLYDQIGHSEKSTYYSNLVKEYQLKNPYYRYHRALEAFAEGDYDLTLRHLKAALKTQNDDLKFHNLLEATYTKLGDDTRASKASEKTNALPSR